MSLWTCAFSARGSSDPSAVARSRQAGALEHFPCFRHASATVGVYNLKKVPFTAKFRIFRNVYSLFDHACTALAARYTPPRLRAM